MKPEKDKWINSVLNSLEGMQRAEPSPFLFAKIQHQLATRNSPVYIPARTVWLTVASFALLLLLNWRIIDNSSTPKTNDTSDLNTVVSGMQLYPSTNQPYDLWSGQNY
ncbi:MAG: hypothetical protein BGO59_06945 [Spirosoma sp. 48-14]|nr:MAG: hypothetical protein BGO59_06945 [Spirosoma sp. 48-14]